MTLQRSRLFATLSSSAFLLSGTGCAHAAKTPAIKSLAAQARPAKPAAAAAVASAAAPSVVRVVKTAHGFQLMRDGKPYFIKGAGGDGSRTLLHDVGGNSVRTWGADNLEPLLTETRKLDMTVTVGIWLGHKDNGFDYHNPQQVAAQLESAKQALLHYRNAPSLLMWGIGNEMEMGQQDDPAVWTAIEQIAALAKKLDPNHPTMTVVAEIGGSKVADINKYCPDIDVIGINSYGGGPSLAQRYKEAGGVKPYVMTEYGPPGTWELPKNDWGVVAELSSTAKAADYRATYEKAIADQPLCLGAYAFTWGNKQEATATWFGLLLPDGSKLGAVDALSALWTGKPPAYPAPTITSLKVDGETRVPPGAKVQAMLSAASLDADPLKVDWVLQADPLTYSTGGATEAVPPTFPDAIVQADKTHAVVQMPSGGGGYRLYAYVRNTHNGAAVANVPLFVTGTNAIALPSGKKAVLPLAVDDASRPPYVPSGYMGSAGAIKMNPQSTDKPHTGVTCTQATFSASNGWGGVVWQNPANDWGSLPGGWDLTGAKTLSFWARGGQGGEVVTFQYGLLGKDATYPDTATGKMQVTLTPEWKQYTFNLAGQDLTRIKTGFSWVVADPHHPVTFYLDDIRYE